MHLIQKTAPVIAASALCVLLGACQRQAAESDSTAPAADTAPVLADATAGFTWPDSLHVMGDGYPAAGDPCRRLGESAATSNYLDDSAMLVGCPGGEDGAATRTVVAAGGQVVGAAEGVTLISVPMGDANQRMNMGSARTGEATTTTVHAPSDGPSFDCGKATGDIEKLVCGDAELSALDRRMAEVYAAAQAAGTDDALKATQRGWVKGRDDCWKAKDQHQCLVEAYKTRIVQLQLDSGRIEVPTPVELTCDDSSKRFVAVFYNDLDPKAAVLTWGDDQAIVFPMRSGSGARYGRDGVDFWEHQGEATVDFYGNKLVCKAAR